jgi:hypothetical protein
VRTSSTLSKSLCSIKDILAIFPKSKRFLREDNLVSNSVTFLFSWNIGFDIYLLSVGTDMSVGTDPLSFAL